MIIKRGIEYQMGKLIGSGGQGEAYQLIRLDTKETFICKINKNVADIGRAAEEADRLKQYHHKNIVRYVDSFVQSVDLGEVHVLIMENCSEGDLRAFINKTKGDPKHAATYWKYFRDIVEGLVELHSR